jgi:flagellar protein FliJ
LQGYRVMKSRDSALRTKRFEVAEKARKADDLGVKDPAHFSYSTYAKAASLRREKLMVSVADLKVQLDAALAAHRAAREELEALEADEARDTARTMGKMERNGLAFG